MVQHFLTQCLAQSTLQNLVPRMGSGNKMHLMVQFQCEHVGQDKVLILALRDQKSLRLVDLVRSLWRGASYKTMSLKV